MSSSTQTVRDFFGPEGLLSQRLPGYESRPLQVEMAALVAETLSAKTRAVVEAGTGTGKTLAYLIPAVLSGKRVLISTATKNLQEQIFYKDIPFLRQQLGLEFTAAYLKGRSNYLCRHRFDAFQQSPLFRSREDTAHFAAIIEWARKTETGDRAELDFLPDNYATWGELSTSADNCLGSKCSRFEDCFVTTVRRKAANAQVLIVNHHLFFADISVRANSEAEVLPDVDAVVFDEAHHLESSASSFFGTVVSQFRLLDLLADVDRGFASTEKGFELLKAEATASRHLSELLAQVGTALPEDRAELGPDITSRPQVQTPLAGAEEAISNLAVRLRNATALGELAETYSRRATELRSDLSFTMRREDSGWVYFAERKRQAVFLRATPIDLSQFFTDLVYPKHPTTVMTSATLTVGGSFAYFRSGVALSPTEPVSERSLDGAFDYMNQSLLYVPENLPQPNAPDFVEAITPVVRELLELTVGRAFVLCTSYRNMNALYEALVDNLPFNILVQGERSRSALLTEFRQKPSVLFATASFWEGVDVQGANLSLVIMDKLPFASPFDPVVKARINYIKEQGGNPFRHFQLPQAAVQLKQGFGRLIRHRNDVGIVSILDRRLLDKPYGRLFLDSLPRTRRTRNLDIVRRWWDKKGGQDTSAT